ncbi:MAG: hypothetical protein COT81_03275 [Candidatus Buchananbacteria bacterium CG10_big_fil_rev_8_21_14_0_10_42_9]|uniref:Uncharacterized protein n=1 Tax=Candidatus Buchananbacteria bacterium CG10_big_fil_rev_8_21_14_0_10_42_9 TaxID=1974526 RepID=A0A2H0W120_9BACT|nr:MAG: hypothetical protein COT81_03275 [Candidatus Buchananbacteria bacterium CG10_big_fil_rev_8_21_14_0_10_42_9]
MPEFKAVFDCGYAQSVTGPDGKTVRIGDQVAFTTANKVEIGIVRHIFVTESGRSPILTISVDHSRYSRYRTWAELKVC